jgi:hypothetical protein
MNSKLALDQIGNIEEARRIATFMRDKVVEYGEPHSARKDWTDAVQDAFGALLENDGYSNNSEVLPHGTKEDRHSRKDAFLLDFVLWRRDLGKENEEGAWIACESEWNRDSKSVLEDFDKLLSFRAPYKLMVYSAKEHGTLGQICRTEFKKRLTGFHWRLSGEIYIFLEFVDSDRKANIYICEPSKGLDLILQH